MEARWSKLLPEILESISDRLPLHDFIRFRGVCRHWRSSPSGRSEITKFPKDELWFLFYDFKTDINDDGANCYLYTKSQPDCCTIRSPHLCGATVVHSKFGWLLAHQNGQFFFYHPLSFIKIDLPRHAVTNDQVYTFTTLPTISHCTVFIVSRWRDSELEVSYCQLGDTKWTTHSIDVNMDRIGRLTLLMSCCNCTTCVCDCPDKNEFMVCDQSKWLVYNNEKRVVVIEGNSGFSEVNSDHFFETYKRHCDNWTSMFGDNGMSIDCCATSGVKMADSGEPFAIFAWTESVTDDGGEKNKFNLVKSALIEPIYATKEMK